MTLLRSSDTRARRSAIGNHRRCRATEVRLEFESLEDRQLLTIAISGAPNDDAASLLSYGGPGDSSLPGFDNVGTSSTGGASVVYLGGGWALTANHVTINNPPNGSPGGVNFGGVQYLIDTNTPIHQLHNPNGSGADVKIFKIVGDPGLPGILPSSIATAPPDLGEHVFMIGNGLTRGDEHFWSVDSGEYPWVWTETTEPPVPGPWDESGFDIDFPRRIRWAENEVDSNNQFLASVWGYLTEFDNMAYTGVPALTHEGQATNGDSGGPTFYYADGKWVLSGIIVTVSSSLSGQPSSTTLLGSETLIADLSYYRDEILSIAGVMGRHVFYNNSTFDAGQSALNSADDDAIATDKVAYRPGSGVAGPENATSYLSGINGIMVDLASDHGPLTQDDFTFRISGTGLDVNNTPSTWAAAPAPTGFTVRPGAGEGGSDRVEIAWPDGTIANAWLEVTVEGDDVVGAFNTNTGLAASDVFYFGNKIGDTFSEGTTGFFWVDASDEIEIRNSQGLALSTSSLFDFNRDMSIDASDQIIARNNLGLMGAIDISNPPAAPTPLPANAVGELNSAALAVTLGQATPTRGDSLQPAPWIAPTVEIRRTPRERIFEQLALVRPDEWLLADDDDDTSAGDERLPTADVFDSQSPGQDQLNRSTG